MVQLLSRGLVTYLQISTPNRPLFSVVVMQGDCPWPCIDPREFMVVQRILRLHHVTHTFWHHLRRLDGHDRDPRAGLDDNLEIVAATLGVHSPFSGDYNVVGSHALETFLAHEDILAHASATSSESQKRGYTCTVSVYEIVSSLLIFSLPKVHCPRQLSGSRSKLRQHPTAAT
ncbi:hypothetical protein AC579_5645 [Pseudocercospora musae]|uniref:Uncharacterized protein n=1 Tax=Pseudocercospora musae TaxID=113226 RepID=A0A139IEX3_9PEZI|nr:hypothetical protein AC579_5645 [Pseudocercospora musae]